MFTLSDSVWKDPLILVFFFISLYTVRTVKLSRSVLSLVTPVPFKMWHKQFVVNESRYPFLSKACCLVSLSLGFFHYEEKLMVRISFVNRQRWVKTVSCLLLKQTRLFLQRQTWISKESTG